MLRRTDRLCAAGSPREQLRELADLIVAQVGLEHLGLKQSRARVGVQPELQEDAPEQELRLACTTCTLRCSALRC
jgi:hypothetical protein